MKKNNIKKEKIKYLKYNNQDKANKRLTAISVFTFICFGIILGRLFYLNIFLCDYYQIILKNKTSSIISGQSVPRGRIYDRNGKLLVDNVAIKKIYYLKNKEISDEDEISLAYEVSNILDLSYNDISERNLKEFFLLLNPEIGSKKITNQEYLDFENRKLTIDQIYELKIDRITEDDLQQLSQKDRRAAYLYYLMNRGYADTEKTIKVENVTDKEYAYISEHTDELKGFNTKLDWQRVYLYGDTLRNILGSVSTEKVGIPYEKKDYYLAKGYSLDDRVGISGIEEEYEDILKGEKAKYKILDNGRLKLINEGKKGNDILLSIDIDLQLKIEEILKEEILRAKKEANTDFYNRSFVIMENPQTGEIYAMAGKQVQKNSLGKYEIYDYSIGNITSTVTPGSVVKGASITVGYNTGVIQIGTVMEDRCIKLLNMPEKCSWKNLGTINDLQAIQWSSNVYQYKIAMKVGKFNYKYNTMLNIDLDAFDIYRQTFYQFGLGVKTGIDFPIEEDGYGGGKYAGDLLINYAIGQYDTYTPLQLLQYVSTIANNGSRMKTRFLKQVLDNNGNLLYEVSPVELNKVQTEDKYLKRIQQGFQMVMRNGTGVDFMGNSSKPAGKTGTSESFVDDNDDGIYDHATMSNNFVGYAPYDNPIMSIVVSSPDIQDIAKGTFKSNVNYRISRRSSNTFFNFYNINGVRK